MSGKSYYHTYYLFARPSFIEGYGRIFDTGGTLNIYNEHATPEEADYAALKRDWLSVGDDIKESINEHERQYTDR